MMNAKTLLVASSVGVMGIGQVQAQAVEWVGAALSNWTTPGSWNSGVVPAGPTAIARFSDASDQAVLNTAVAPIGSLELLDADADLFLDAAGTLSLLGTATVNNGTIQLNRNGSNSNAVLSIEDAMAVTGSGEIWMRTSIDNSQIAGLGSLTNGAAHTIRGVGRIMIPVTNNNRIAADVSVSVSGNDLEIRSDVDNNDTLAAAAGSLLEIFGGVTVIQSASATIIGETGTVALLPASTVIGGLFETSGGGLVSTAGGGGVVTLDSTMNLASPFIVAPNTNVEIVGAGLINEGVFQLNPNGSNSNSTVTFADSGSLTGSGEMLMRTSIDNSQLNTAPGMTITHTADHTIRGVGRIAASMDNAGTVLADVSASVSGNTLELEINDKANTGLFSAEAGSFLDIQDIAIDQTGGGEIRANTGVVRISGASSVTNGSITSDTDGNVNILSASTTTADNVLIDADFFVDPNATLDVAAGGIVNSRTITLNPTGSNANSILTTAVDTNIDGTGTIRMRTSLDNSQINTTAGATITHSATHTIRGVGQVNAAFVNNGVIRADISDSVSGNLLELQGGDKINNNLISCELNSLLDIDGITITQDPSALIVANDGVVQIKTAAQIIDGFINTTGIGVFRTISGSSSLLSSVVNAGTLQIDPNTTVTIDAAGLTNNGLIEMNRLGSSADSILNLADASITGIGEIRMRTFGNNAQITTDPGTTGTLGADQFVRGVGQITGAITNDGEIRADVSVSVSGNSMELLDEDKVNNADIIAATGSTLFISGVSVDQSGGGMILADEGTVTLRTDATIDGGFLGSANGGLWQTSTGGFNVDGSLLTGIGRVNAGHTLDVLGGTLFNDASVLVNPQGSTADAIIAFDVPTTLLGTGSIDLVTFGANSRFTSTAEGAVTLTNGAGHTVTGTGQIQIPFLNDGIVIPGRPNGSLEALDGATLNSGGTFVARLNTTGVLDVTNDATLGGTLDIQLTSSPLANGNNRVILTADTIIGEFDTVNFLVDGQLITRVRYETNEVVIRTRCLADTNLDGAVTPADFNSWIAAFNSQDSVADQNLDGLISPSDFNAWIINFNNGCP